MLRLRCLARVTIIWTKSAHEWRAPAAFGGGDRQCYDSGTISMNQNKNTINTSLTDYKFNGEFPVRFVGADPGSTAINYADNIGHISIWNKARRIIIFVHFVII